jgi:hypothetical protein
MDCDAALDRWSSMLDRIDDEVGDLVWQRDQIRRIGKMIEQNPQLLESDKPFLWEVRRWYMVFAAIAVRRQNDRGVKLVPLAQLLAEMKASPECITRDLLLKQFQGVYARNAGPSFEKLLVDGDWEKWGDPQTGSLSVERVDADLAELDALSAPLIAFVGSTIAHTSRRAIGKDFKLTFDDLDAAIDQLEKLTLSFRGLLTGASGYSMVPIPQYDWYAQFRFPWQTSAVTGD